MNLCKTSSESISLRIRPRLLSNSVTSLMLAQTEFKIWQADKRLEPMELLSHNILLNYQSDVWFHIDNTPCQLSWLRGISYCKGST